jgi:hypothetical protein
MATHSMALREKIREKAIAGEASIEAAEAETGKPDISINTSEVHPGESALQAGGVGNY